MNPTIVEEILKHIRWQFYPDDAKGFFQQRRVLIQAVTYPADWLFRRGMKYPEDRYRDLMTVILKGIMHGNTGKIGYFCRYLLKCVQDHMAHQGEKYLEEAKRIDRQIADVMFGLKKATAKTPQHDSTVEDLVAIRRLTAPPKRTKKPKAPSQLDLL